MDSTTSEIIDDVLKQLEKTGVRYLLQVDDVHAGIAIYSNGMTDRLYLVQKDTTTESDN